MRVIDLNSDLGEDISIDGLTAEQLDDALLHVVTSANVACGGHAGDLASMSRICARAGALGVRVGAQISYVDRAGFGRRRLDVPADLLTEQLLEQLTALTACACAVGTDVTYVKPHGALYNAAVDAHEPALAVVNAILRDADERGSTLPVLTLADSTLANLAQQHGITVFTEAFADRAYTAAGRLVPRTEAGAVITDEAEVQARVLTMINDGYVTSIDGIDIPITAQSICVHSDTSGALNLASVLRKAIEDSGIQLRAFTDPR
jgi:5-oxoprolinase (ATP-hydrolysing) subunit A